MLNQRIKILATQTLCCFNSVSSSVRRMPGISLFFSYFSDLARAVLVRCVLRVPSFICCANKGAVTDTVPASMELIAH